MNGLDFMLIILVMLLAFAVGAMLTDMPHNRRELTKAMDDWWARLADNWSYYAEAQDQGMFRRGAYNEYTTSRNTLRGDYEWVTLHMWARWYLIESWVFWRLDKAFRVLHLIPVPYLDQPLHTPPLPARGYSTEYPENADRP